MVRVYTLLLLLVLSSASYAVRVEVCGIHFVDDCLAEAISKPRPKSVSEVLTYIKGKYKDENIEELNFKNNHIGQSGAVAILKYALELPHLRLLNLEINSIDYDTDSSEYLSFETLLLQLLQKEEFEEIRLGDNGIASTAWYSIISQKLVGAYANKIKWQLQD
ncbi:MAG TPA: hypothetical protein DEG23_03635 [Coxiellaceae bacterium]|nr:hypothetical protein [Coxiellaceae bacterium]